MYCVFLVKSNGDKHLLDFFKRESSARRYMDSLRHLKLDGEIIMDFASEDSIRCYINTVFNEGGVENA